ncbi:MAG: hemerythrin domain-containing protein [Magnetococcales bacterium]|nr:hemerythrin domain-containing protein [Magnetococcales bacterium]
MEAKVVHVIIALLKEQHAEIVLDMEHLQEMLRHPVCLECEQNVRKLMKILDQRVILHLVQEDQLLYPKLLQSGYAPIQDMARRFIQEMGGMAVEFSRYMQQWQSADELVTHWEQFVEQTRQLADRLIRRISREENELFPLIDSLDRE